MLFRVSGRYELQEQVAERSGGSVLLAKDRFRGGRTVVLKRLPREGMSREAVARLRHDFLALRQIPHPNVATVLDVTFDESENTYVVATEFVEGLDLLRILRGVPEETGLELVVQVLRALSYVHNRGLVHHRLKPQNVLVESTSRGYRTRLLDFALTPEESLFDEEEPAEVRAARLHYQAPEFFSHGVADHRADLYALGLVLYQAAAGRLPFEDPGDAAAVQAWHRDASADRRPGHPVLDEVIERLLAPDPALRFESAEEVIRAISATTGRFYRADTGETSGAFPSAGKFVGRDEILLRLEDVSRRVLRGEGGCLVLVKGARGLGKTRLLDELRAVSQLEGIRVVGASCHQHRALPLGAMREVLGQLVISLEEDHPAVLHAAAVLSELLPEFAELRPMLPRHVLPPRQDWLRIQNVVVEFLAAAGNARPMLVLLDDLQWIDGASLALLEHFIRHFNGAPVMFIASITPELTEPEGAVGKLLAHPMDASIELEPLDSRAVTDLVGSLLALPGGIEEISELVVRLTRGNPLFIEELLRSLMEGDVASLFCEPEVREDGRGADRAAALIVSRIGRLRPEQLRLLEALSIFDGPAHCSLLTRLSGLGPSTVERAADSLRTLDLLRVQETVGEPLLEISSRLFRDALARELGSARRRRLHDQALHVLMDRGEVSGIGRAAELAYHAMRGSRPLLALQAARAAAKDAIRLHDHGLALTLLHQALAGARAVGSEVECGEVLSELARALELQGDLDGALARLQELHVQRPEDARVMLRTADVLLELGRGDEAEKWSRDALQLPFGTESGRLRCRVLRSLARCLARRGAHDEAGETLEEVLALASLGDDVEEWTRAKVALGLVHGSRGDLDSALRHHEDSLRGALRARDRIGVATAHVNIGLVLWHRGRLPEALRQYQRAERLAQRLGHYLVLAVSLQNRGIIELDLGRLDEAMRTLSESSRLRRRLDDEPGVARSMANLALVHYAAARHGLALQLLQESCLQRDKLGDRQGLATVHTNLGTVLTDLGDIDRATTHYATALALARTLGAPASVATTLLETAALDLRHREWEPARRAAIEARRIFDKLSRPDDRARADLVLARLEIESGDRAGARPRLAGALRILRRTGRVLPLIAGRSLAGLVREGGAGLASLAAARRLADRCGLREQAWGVRHLEGRKFLEMGRHRESAAVLREGMEILRGIHGELPASLRALYLTDPLKTDLRALFAEATERVPVGGPS